MIANGSRKRELYSDPNRKPKAIWPDDYNIPDAMKNERRWLLWRLEWVTDKKGKGNWSKTPYQTNGRKARTNDPKTWTDFSSVWAACESGEFDGIGFVLGDGWAGVDLDDVCEVSSFGIPHLSDTAKGIVGRFDTHAEVSPSQTGVKLFGRGEWLADWHKKQLPGGGEIEVYGSGRYFTVTGRSLLAENYTKPPLTDIQQQLDDLAKRFAEKAPASDPSATPKPSISGDDHDLIEKAKNAKNGAAFAALWTGDTSAYGDDPSRADLALVGMLIFWCGGDRARADRLFRQSGLYRSKWDAKRGVKTYGERTLDKAMAGKTEFYTPGANGKPKKGQAPATVKSYPSPLDGEAWNDPHRLARFFVEENLALGETTIRQWRDEFHRWDGASWRSIPDTDLDSTLARFARHVFETDYPYRLLGYEKRKASGESVGNVPVIYPVTSRVKSDLRLNLGGLVNLPDAGVDATFWQADTSCRPNAAEVIAAPNGLFTLPDIASEHGPFSPPTPQFFTPNALPFPVPGVSQKPEIWLRCLDEWFGGDPASILGLQEVMGYFLSATTCAHKIVLLVGPRRSGKGTVIRTILELVGAPNVASTSFAALGENFGLEDLLGKRVAIIPDARLSGRSDIASVVERLLSISGEDPQSVNRKNRRRITTLLKTRFLIATNEIPRLPDASGALASRFHILPMPNCFSGREDKTLKKKLRAELPGILVWAARGYVRFRCQDFTFTQNDAAAKYHRELEDLSSPVRAFVRERCSTGPEFEVRMADLFAQWKDWNAVRNRQPSDDNIFGRDLTAAFPHIKRGQPRVDGFKVRVYKGIGLRARAEWGDEDDELERGGTRSNPTDACAPPQGAMYVVR